MSRDRRALSVGNEAPVWHEQNRRPVSPGHSRPALADAQQHHDIPPHLNAHEYEVNIDSITGLA